MIPGRATVLLGCAGSQGVFSPPEVAATRSTTIRCYGEQATGTVRTEARSAVAWPCPERISSRAPVLPPPRHRSSMIVVDETQIGVGDKCEKISPADPARRLVVEWTAQLPASRRSTARP